MDLKDGGVQFENLIFTQLEIKTGGGGQGHKV